MSDFSQASQLSQDSSQFSQDAMFTPVDAEGNMNGETVPFAEGWLDENGEYLGRPVDVAQLKDGSLLVSDDLAGAVYRIAYTGSGS